MSDNSNSHRADGWTIGIDVGGTFTDITAVNAQTGQVEVLKLPSTPLHPDEAMLTGFGRLCEKIALNPALVRRVAHGTTVATNALIQNRGARLALITTRGFRDILEIGRQVRPNIFDFHTDPAPPLVTQDMCFEVTERLLADGSVLKPLEEDEIARVVAQVRASQAEVCLVCLIHAFKNPEHERRIAQALRAELADIFVSVSSEVHPEFREFERFSTTAVNGFVQPEMARYLARLSTGLQELGARAAIGISQSSGGLMSLERAAQLPVRTALSGPSAGIMGVLHMVADETRQNLITLDMGGTSADVSMIRDGHPTYTTEREIEGRPVKLASIDINAVGAGGGSIAWIDTDGLMKVGPQSAGAQPGPACYRKGGTSPTVSDANLLLGRLSPTLLDGAMTLDRAAAERVIDGVAQQIGLSQQDAALGVIEIVNATMVRAIRQVSVERGIDPSGFDLVAFGGAGPLHGRDVAEALGMGVVIIPAAPGLLCAQGLLGAPLREDYVQAVGKPLRADTIDAVHSAAHGLMHSANQWFDLEGAQGEVHLRADLRYIGQNFELSIPVTLHSAVEDMRSAFISAHRDMYGHADETAPIEVVALRADASIAYPQMPQRHLAAGAPPPVPTGYRDVVFSEEETVSTPVYRREAIGYGMAINGPAIIEQMDSTIVVGPRDCFSADLRGNLVIEVNRL